MDALLGQEVKLRRGESGRYLGEIDVLARIYGQSGAESPKEAQPPGRGGPGGWLGEGRRAYCSLLSAGRQKSQPLVGWPVTALAAALREAKS